jgi:hypothetical protein
MMMLMLASFAGRAQAVAFDEKLKAPMARGGAELKIQADSYSASFARLSTVSPAEMVTNRALSQEYFDLNWQLNRALEDKRPPAFGARAQWRRLRPESIPPQKLQPELRTPKESDFWVMAGTAWLWLCLRRRGESLSPTALPTITRSQ